VHENVGVTRRLEYDSRGTRVACEHDLPPRPRWTEDLMGPNRAPIRELDRLAGLQTAKQGSLGNAEACRGLDVEPTGSRALDEGVAVGGDAVLDVKHADGVVAAVQRLARPQLDELELVRELPEHAPESPEEVDEPRRPVDRERRGATAERERLQHSRQAEVVVRVIVGDEDLGELDESYRRP
jgi:hypothetical protein